MSMRLLVATAILILPLALDLIVKKLAQHTLDYAQPVAVLPGFNLTLLYNPGVSFGLFPVGTSGGLQYMLTLQAMLCLGIAAYAWTVRQLTNVWPLVLLLSGALANLVDRFFNGAVTDYLDFYVGSSHWPAFNLADVWITLGVVGIIGLEFVKKPLQKSVE